MERRYFLGLLGLTTAAAALTVEMEAARLGLPIPRGLLDTLPRRRWWGTAQPWVEVSGPKYVSADSFDILDLLVRARGADLHRGEMALGSNGAPVGIVLAPTLERGNYGWVRTRGLVFVKVANG